MKVQSSSLDAYVNQDQPVSALLRSSQIQVRNARVFRWWDYPIFAILSALVAFTTCYFIYHWYSLGDFQGLSLIPVLVLAVVLLNVGIILLRWVTLPLMKQPLSMQPERGYKVGVATTFVPGAESFHMLEETVRTIIAMDYPHDTWVLDEGDDDKVRSLCHRLGANHFSRKGITRYNAPTGRFQARTKHGNYNAWLDAVGFEQYDVIVNFDPDHTPVRRFLTSVLGYLRDPEVGYVQSAQAYYNQGASFISRGAAEETYAFYSSIQMTSYALGYPIAVGCHTVHRTSALREVGGFAPHEADDLLITVLYRSTGWRGVYVPDMLAYGLTPVDWAGYLGQQRRWARSTLDIKFRLYAKLSDKLPFTERVIGWVHGLYYLQGITSALLITLVGAILLTGTEIRVVSAASFPVFLGMIVSLQACELYRQRFFLNPRGEIGLHIRSSILAAAKWPYILLAFVDVVWRSDRLSYILTPKGGSQSRSYPLLIPNLAVILFVSTCWLAGSSFGSEVQPGVGVLASMIVGNSVLLILLQFLPFPSPYEPGNQTWRRDRVGAE